MSLPTIKIIGEAGSGKSTLAWLIKQAAEIYGIPVTITGCEDERPEDIEQLWPKRIESFKGHPLTIETIQSRA